MSANPDDFLGRTMGPFALDRLLGEGGFAWVFAAHRVDDGTPKAVKALKPRYAADRQFSQRFRNEYEVVSELSHPHIVRITDVGTEGGISYFAMDRYVDSLASLLERDGPLPEERAIAIGIEIADALAYAHKAGIIHRDIKVDNILLREDGSAVLADFGIARAVSGYVSATGVNMTIGTPQYVSPEQAQGRPLDGRSDLYALGVTLYKALTGQLPFRSTDWFELARMHVEDSPTPPSERRPGISHRVERIVLRCLAKHPDDRYASADDLLDDLRQVQAGTRKTSDILVPPPRSARFPERGGRSAPAWLKVTLGVVLVVLIAVVVALLGRR